MALRKILGSPTLRIDPCDIRHVGRRNNTIYVLWEIKSIVMHSLFCLPTWHMSQVFVGPLPNVALLFPVVFYFCLVKL